MTGVISLHGGPVLDPATDRAELVKEIEFLLNRAKRGELVGIAYAAALGNGEPSTGWLGCTGTRYVLGSAIGVLSHRYMEALNDSATKVTD